MAGFFSNMIWDALILKYKSKTNIMNKKYNNGKKQWLWKLFRKVMPFVDIFGLVKRKKSES